jgi:hypothetical protein
MYKDQTLPGLLYGGRSSMEEHLVVAQGIAGSRPAVRPQAERYSSQLQCRVIHQRHLPVAGRSLVVIVVIGINRCSSVRIRYPALAGNCVCRDRLNGRTPSLSSCSHLPESFLPSGRGEMITACQAGNAGPIPAHGSNLFKISCRDSSTVEQSICVLCPSGFQNRLGRGRMVIRLLVRAQLPAPGGPVSARYQTRRSLPANVTCLPAMIKPGRNGQVITLHEAAWR